jgi:hypothetical protein
MEQDGEKSFFNIWGSHSGSYEEFWLLGHNAISSHVSEEYVFSSGYAFTPILTSHAFCIVSSVRES